MQSRSFHRSLSCADLFEKSWGWDAILPRAHPDEWPQYKEYLSAYYNHNVTDVGNVDLNDIKTLAHKVPPCLPLCSV